MNKQTNLRPRIWLLIVLLISTFTTQAHEGIFFVKTVAGNAGYGYMPNTANPLQTQN